MIEKSQIYNPAKDPNLTLAEIIEIYVQDYGVPRSKAEFMIALARGETNSEYLEKRADGGFSVHQID